MAKHTITKIFEKWGPDDVISLVCLVGLLLLLLAGHNGILNTAFVGVVAAYLGKKYLNGYRREVKSRRNTRSK